MNKDAEKFLEKMLNTPSPSGFEQPVAKIFRDRVKGYADIIDHDVHGNSFAILNPDAEFKFMIAGHIDEIGLMITHIDKEGYISCAMIGEAVSATAVTAEKKRIIDMSKMLTLSTNIS